MDEVILKNLDHKNLDKDVSYFSDKVCRKCWDERSKFEYLNN